MPIIYDPAINPRADNVTLSLVSEVKSAASKIIEHTGGHVDYLVETQGGPPNGTFSLTSEGIEAHFAVQSVSRFGLAYLLAHDGALKDTVVFVCAPGGKDGVPPAVDDLDLKKAYEMKLYGFFKVVKNEGAVLDAVTKVSKPTLCTCFSSSDRFLI